MASIKEKLKSLDRCLHYALMPNQLHLCGPDNQADVLEFYLGTQKQPKLIDSLNQMFKGFETLYPYLRLIAKYNNYKDPLSEKIIEAYWLGNNALTKVTPGGYYNYLKDDLEQKKKLGPKEFDNFTNKFDLAVLPHHNFHVFSLARRTGKVPIYHTLATMDLCRISWGKVKEIIADQLMVITRPLAIDNQGRIYEADFIERKILNNLNGIKLVNNLKIGDYLSMHWGSACEKLSLKQVKNLQYYTKLSLRYAVNFYK